MVRHECNPFTIVMYTIIDELVCMCELLSYLYGLTFAAANIVPIGFVVVCPKW